MLHWRPYRPFGGDSPTSPLNSPLHDCDQAALDDLSDLSDLTALEEIELIFSDERSDLFDAARAHDSQAALAAIALGADPLAQTPHGDNLALSAALGSALNGRWPGFDALIQALLPLCAPPEPEPVSPSALIAAELIGRPDFALPWLSRCGPMALAWDGQSALCKAIEFQLEPLALELLDSLALAMKSAHSDAASAARSLCLRALACAAERGLAQACAKAAELVSAGEPWKALSPALSIAAENGQAGAVAALLPFYDPQADSDDILAALALCAKTGHVSIIHLLAPLVAPCARSRGLTPLMIASREANPGAVEALLPFSNPRLLTSKGSSSLALAAMAEHDHPMAARCVALLAPLCDIDALDERHESALSLAIGAENPLAVSELIRAGASLSRLHSGFTPLAFAAQNSSAACVAALLPHCDPNEPSFPRADALMFQHGASAAALALAHQRFDCLEAMLPKINLFAPIQQASLLSRALGADASEASSAFLDAALALGERELWPEDCSHEFFRALSRGHSGWIEALMPRARLGAAHPPFGSDTLMAAAHGAPGLLPRILPHGDPAATGQHRMSALMWAANAGHEAAVELLLPLSNPRELNFKGESALSLAIRGRHEACARLLSPSADPLWTGAYGESLFQLAVESGSEGLMRVAAPFARPWSQEVDLRGRDLADALIHSLSRITRPADRLSALQRRLGCLLELAPLDPQSPPARALAQRLSQALGSSGAADQIQERVQALLERSELRRGAPAAPSPHPPASPRRL